MRCPNAGRYKTTIAGYFDDYEEAAREIAKLSNYSNGNGKTPAVYITLNRIKSDLLARYYNRLEYKAKETTSDRDILSLEWLPIDIDAVRPAGISSTDAEHQAAIEKVREIKAGLISQGWPENAFIWADSGNGGHLTAKICLENTKENIELIKACLEALDKQYSDEDCKVDLTTHNPSRIWKVPGTAVRKGDDTPTRPHRMAKLLERPEILETVPREKLEALAAKLQKADIKSDWRADMARACASGFSPAQYAEAHGAHVIRVESWTDKEGGKWELAILKECPFDPSHNRGEARVGVREDGKRTFRCFHDSCLGKDWYALRNLWEPERSDEKTLAYEDYNPALTREIANEIEAVTGVHIYNASDDAKVGEISEEELNAYSLPEGPKFNCNLPKDHFIQRFMAYGSDISDAYMEYWFAGALFALAVVSDKKIKVVLRQGSIHPNLYISINGKSSLARKSTVVDKTEAMLCQVLPGLLSSLVPTEFSPEAFTEHLSDHNHAPWIRDEAAGVLSLMKRDYMRGFKDSLMQLFDCKPFYRKLRTSQRKSTKTEFRVDDPYLNVLFATTDASLGANTEQNDTLSGFMARFLFFFPQGKKNRWLPLEEGTAANSMFEDVVRGQLADIAARVGKLTECKQMHFSPEAARYYTEWQRVREEEWTASNDGNAMQIYSRLAPTVTKLGMLFELGSPDFDISRPIRLEHIQEACQLVDSYFMPTARVVYDLVGSNAEKNVIDRIIAYLKKHNGKASKKEIMRDVKIKSADFNEYLATMEESDAVETKTVKRGGKGRDSLWVFLLDQAIVGDVVTVDNVAIVAKVEEIPSKSIDENVDGKISTLATLATMSTSSIVATVKEEPATIRFKTDYKTDIDGKMRQFQEGDVIAVSSWRAQSWQKRGVAEIVGA